MSNDPQSQPWSPAEAEQRLALLIDVLGDSVTDVRDVAVAAATSRHRYELAEARAFTSYRSTGIAQEEAKRRALVDAENEHLAYLTSEAVAKAAFKHIDVLKAQCDGLRSLLVSARGVT